MSGSPGGFRANPWVQLAAGVICMAAIANYQYGWTYFVPAMQDANGWSNANIQWAFTLFITLEVWLVPIEGPLVDKYGPKWIVLFGGIIAALGWLINAHAATVQMLWVGNAVTGIGAGMVYGTCIGNAVKWFGNRRGLAAGLTSMGFGAGAAITVAPILNMIKEHGYSYTFTFFGIAQGVIIVLASLFLMMPPKTLAAAPKVTRLLQGTRDYTPGEVVRSPVFWVMFLMFVLVAAGGLVAVAQLATIAKDFYIDQFPVTILFWTQAALAWSGQFNNIVNGGTRPILGALSDRFGRENVMSAAFLVEGIGIFCLWKFGTTPIAFVLLSGVVFFAWGEIYSIFPATSRDHFGQKYATTNYGMLYMAKWVASYGVPISGYVLVATHGWGAILGITAAMNIVAAILAIAVLKPLRIWDVRRNQALASGTTA